MKNTNNNEGLSPKNEKIINSSKAIPINNIFAKSKEQSPLRKNKSNIISHEEESEKNSKDSLNNNTKLKSSLIKNISSKKSIIKNNVFNILSKDFQYRSGQEIRFAAEYLSKSCKYFINLKNNDSLFKVEKLTKICKLEKFSPGQDIILYGDIGDKFYIVLEGQIEIYKPEYVEQLMTPIEYLEILNDLKENDELKYLRVKNKNDTFYFDTIDIDKIDQNTAFMRNKYNFLIEVEEKKGEYGEGFSFGEIALIKKTTRNATIRSIDNTIVLSIAKDDYNLAMKEIDSKKLSVEVEQFRKNYQFFNCLDIEKMIKLFNCLSKSVLYKGDYLYHQNDTNDNIYIIIRGTFEVYSHISFSWLNEYFNYIDDSMTNILFYMIKNHNMKYSELREIIKNIKVDSLNSPMKDLDYNNLNDVNIYNMNKNNMKDNLYLIKNDEEKINDKKSIFKLNLKKIDYYDLIGIEDCFEFKKKLYSVRCVSSSAEVKIIKINELLRIIWHSSNEDLLYLLRIIIDRKKILKNEIINSVKNLEKKILLKFDIRYENLINYDQNIYSPKNNTCLKDKIKNNYFKNFTKFKNKENEVNRVISAIKAKGYKKSIQDILDENLKFLSKNQTKMEKKIYRNQSAINLNILKNLLKDKPPHSNQFYFKKNISNFFKSDNDLQNNMSYYLSPISSKRFTNYTSLKNNVNSFREFSGFSSQGENNNYIQIKKENNIFKLKNINYKKHSFQNSKNRKKSPINNIKKINRTILHKIKFNNKDFGKEKHNNLENNKIINKPNLLRINSVNRLKYKLDINRKSELFSPKNNVRMRQILSLTNSNIEQITNNIGSATIRVDKMGNMYKKNILNNFNKNNKLKNKININLSGDENSIKNKKKKYILSNDNKHNITRNVYSINNIYDVLGLNKNTLFSGAYLKHKHKYFSPKTSNKFSVLKNE